MTETLDNTADRPSLKRVLGLPLITLYGIGGIIGAGIYVLIGKIAGVAGLLAPFAFLVAASIALFSALSYAELSSRLPSSGGEVTFIRQGFRSNWLSLIVGLAICFGGIVSSAAIARGATGYLQLYLDTEVIVLLTGFVLIIGALACWGVLESVGIAALITAIEIGGLIIVCFIGAPNLPELTEQKQAMLPSLDWQDWAAIFGAALLAFYAYIGFEDMVNMGEEVVDPGRNMPLAILLALAVTTLLYIVVALVFIASMPVDLLAQTAAPFAEIVQRNSTLPTSFITIISLLAITNGALIQIIMSARILFGMSHHQLLPAFFGQVNPRTQTPINSTVLVSVLVFLFASSLPIESLARITSYILLTVFAMVNFSLILIKRRDHAQSQGEATETGQGSKHFSVPLFAPVIGFVLCAAFLLVQLV